MNVRVNIFAPYILTSSPRGFFGLETIKAVSRGHYGRWNEVLRIAGTEIAGVSGNFDRRCGGVARLQGRARLADPSRTNRDQVCVPSVREAWAWPMSGMHASPKALSDRGGSAQFQVVFPDKLATRNAGKIVGPGLVKVDPPQRRPGNYGAPCFTFCYNNFMKTLAKKIFWLVALITWMSLMFYLSSIPGLQSGFSWDFVLRKIAHMGEYGILTFLAYKNIVSFFGSSSSGIVLSQLRAQSRKNHSRAETYQRTNIFLGAFLFALAYAVSDEIHQHFVANRHGTSRDLIYDAVGSLAMIAVITLWPKVYDFLRGKK